MLVFDFFLLGTALLVVGIALSRTRAAEEEAERLREELARRDEPLEQQEALAAIGLLTSELCEMIISPLTVLLGQCELGRRRDTGPERIATIERQARRIAAVVERHRAFAPSRRGDLRAVDPLRVADETLRFAAPEAAERAVALHREYDAVPPIQTNAFLLRKALRHLLGAALRSGAQDVTLAVGTLDGALLFCVADDGPGMDENQQRSALRPFDDGAVRSTGVSYAIASAIAEATGGQLLLESAPGEGTRASLRLPLPVQQWEEHGPAQGEPGVGAPDGNRTHVSSLGSWRSTIELQAHADRQA